MQLGLLPIVPMERVVAVSKELGQPTLSTTCSVDENACGDGQFSSPWLVSLGPLALAAIGFFLFGLALTANSQITSGGTWTLYAMLMEEGARPYSDLHLPQQPLFFLFNRLWYAIAGQNWILSQVSAAILLALFCNGYFRLAKRMSWPSWQKALVFLSASLVAIGWEYYSFFDYRAFTDVFALYAVLLLVRLHDAPERDDVSLKWPIVLGCLVGLSFATRANDGLMLLIALVAILSHWFPQRLLRNSLLLVSAAAATVGGVVLMTGETLTTYFEYTLHSAPAMKGGTGQVVVSPILLAIDILSYVARPWLLLLSVILFAAVAFPAVLISGATKGGWISSKRTRIVLIAALVLFETNWVALYSIVPNIMLPWLQLLLIALSISAALIVLRIQKIENRRSVLMLVPGGALVAAGMSSGGDHFGLFGPIGLMIMLLPLTFGEAISGRNRAILLTAFAVLAATILVGKVRVPMQWKHYRANTMFVNREVIDRPHQGPMLVERDMNAFFSEVCRTIAAEGVGTGLLSLPYSYANYNCGIAPWRRYVQTYFDTSSAATIDGLRQELDKAAPTWIVYQRQLDEIRASELAFNHGYPIRHRGLDADIWNRLQRHEWTVVRHWQEEPGSDWYFIRTSPPN